MVSGKSNVSGVPRKLVRYTLDAALLISLVLFLFSIVSERVSELFTHFEAIC